MFSKRPQNQRPGEWRSPLFIEVRRLGLRAKRQIGQNFLIDHEVVSALVRAGSVEPGSRVLEIGPGIGAVTSELVAQGAQVIAVELDQRLLPVLKKKFSRTQQVQIIAGNILDLHLSDFVTDGQYLLISSLPFQITSLVFRNFLEYAPRPERMALIVQEEVARRVTAPPGKMSLLSVSVQYLGYPTYIMTVPRTSFWPAPDVDAAIVRVDVRELPPAAERQAIFQLVRAGFSARRKMLRNNLEAALRLPAGAMGDALTRIGLPAEARAQELSVDQWLELAKNLL